MKKLASLLVALLLLAIPSFAQDSEDDLSTIAEIVVSSTEAEDAEFTTLLAALEAADPAILERLSDPEMVTTVFAPTDAAFEALQEALGEETFNEILTEDGTPRLNEILGFHAVDANITSTAVIEELEAREADEDKAVSLPVVTLSGQTWDLAGSVEDAGTLDLSKGVTVGDANLVLDMVDIEASNGYIHVIDAVLVPQFPTIADTVVAAATAEENAEFTTLLTAVQEADPAVLELLSDPTAEVTVFAPTDEAFAAVEGLEDIVADTALLTQILQYHVYEGTVYSFQLGDIVNEDGTATIEMADGSEATITLTEDGVMLNDANIVLEMTDIETSNGIIHVIDGVIVPEME